METVTFAREYLCNYGFSVIPVGIDKKPLIEWKEFQRRFPTVKELDEWFSKDDVNIAIVTGAISDLVVLDVDGEEGIRSITENKLHIPETSMVKTGRGFHYYFRYREGVKNLTDYYPGIDLRGEGGYVLAPPSLHSSGVRYRWVRPLTKNLAEIPEWIIKRDTETKKKELNWVDVLLRGVESGRRNDSLASLAGHFFGKNLGFNETLSILLDWNRRNNPPLPDAEVIKTVESIYKREREKISLKEGKPDIELLFDDPLDIDNINAPFIARYLDIASSITDAPKDYHLGSILAVLSTVIGPNVSSPIMTGLTRKLKPNLYVLLIGESSLFRKSTALYLAVELLKKIPDCFGEDSKEEEKRYGLILPQSFSPEALLVILSKRDGRPSLLVKDEISGLLNAFRRTYMAGTKEDLIKLYDGDRIEQMTLGRGYIRICNPYLSWLSATTPDSFSSAFEDGDISSGLIPRFLVVYPDNHGWGKRIEIISDDLENFPRFSSLQEDIKKIYSYWGKNRVTYHLSERGLEIFNRLISKLETMIDKEPNLDKTLARIPWISYKIAMILQAVDDGLEISREEKDLIRDDYLLLAISIVNRFIPQTLKAIEIIGQSETNRVINKIIRYLSSEPKGRRDIMRKFHLTSDFTDKIRRTMIERELIDVKRAPNEVWRLR